MKLLLLPTTAPALNLACEELLSETAQEPLFMLWRNEPSIIVGCNQNTAAEIDGDFVRTHGIHVVRRCTGGGAVYHDLGNINYSCIVQERLWGADSAERFTAPIVHALQELGVDATFSGRNDILANGCKISGCARSVPRGHTLFHGTLLFDTDLDILAQALRPDPEKITSKGIQSVRARVGNIRGMLPPAYAGMTMEDFIRHLLHSVSCFHDGTPFEEPSDELLAAAEGLAERKYRTWEWTYGTALDYQVHNRLRFAGGIIHAEFNVEKNHIADLRLSGDFFGARPVAELLDAIRGLPPQYDALLPAIAALPYREYIAGITAEELAKLLAV